MIKVATFFAQADGFGNTDKRPTLRRVSAYTMWYNPQWAGCIEYCVPKSTGTEAKKHAKKLRLAHEIRLWEQTRK